jgi:hypothetical protein
MFILYCCNLVHVLSLKPLGAHGYNYKQKYMLAGPSISNNYSTLAAWLAKKFIKNRHLQIKRCSMSYDAGHKRIRPSNCLWQTVSCVLED